MPSNTAIETTPLTATAEQFLLELVDTPAPSGFEQPAADVWRAYAKQFAQVDSDGVGNSYATINAGADKRVALSGHLDEIGLIVTKIDDKGFLRCTNIGGWDIAVLIGQRVRIVTESGAVIGSIGRPAVHALSAGDREKLPKLSDLWIDIGAEDGDAAREQVTVGDPIVLDASPVRLGEHRLLSRSLDDRIGAFIALEVVRELAESDDPVGVEVVAVGSTSEEIGAAGAQTAAYFLRPHVAVAIDVTTPSDTPSGSDTGDFSLGKGPIVTRGASTNAPVVDALIDVARTNDIPHQLRGMGIRTRTDADAIAKAGPGVPVGLLSVPARYLHSPCEQVDLRDVRATIDLLVAWIRTLGN